MRLVVTAFGLLIAAACGGAASPAESPPPAVEVASPGDEEIAASDVDEGDVPDSEPSPTSGLDICLRAVRDADVGEGDDADLYREALLAERAGSMGDAKAAYTRLVQSFPRSPYVPLVYLAFAELFHAESTADSSHLDLALSAYQRVLRYPPPKNVAYRVARYRLAQVHGLRGDHREALAAYVKVVEQREPPGRCDPYLRDLASRGLVQAYSFVGRAKRALPFFRRVAGGDDSRAHDLLADLAAEFEKRDDDISARETVRIGIAAGGRGKLCSLAIEWEIDAKGACR